MERDILHRAAVNITEDALVAVTAVDMDAADRASFTVEGAVECVLLVANRGKVIYRSVVSDIVAQLKELIAEGIACIAVGTVHHLGQHIQAGGRGDDVRVVLILAVCAFVLAPEGRPVGGIGPVAVRAGGNRYGGLRRVAVAARPAGKGVARPDGLFIDRHSRIIGVTRGIGCDQAAAREVVGDGVVVAGGYC